MGIVRTADFVECYRYAALTGNVQTLAGRGDDIIGTQYVNTRILSMVGPRNDDVLLDIGCGDGCLLRMAENHVRERIGILPTNEERAKLQDAYPELRVLAGTAEELPLTSHTVSLIVCNAVLLLLQSEERVCTALKEIARVAQPGARIFIGEIPSADEHSAFAHYRGSSVSGLLWHQLSRKGLRTFLGTGKSLFNSIIGRETLLLNSSAIFHALPASFIALAQKCGLQSTWHGKHFRKDKSGNLIESPFRYNYLFTK
jgi:SAM-dependent methyltransferase